MSKEGLVACRPQGSMLAQIVDTDKDLQVETGILIGKRAEITNKSQQFHILFPDLRK